MDAASVDPELRSVLDAALDDAVVNREIDNATMEAADGAPETSVKPEAAEPEAEPPQDDELAKQVRIDGFTRYATGNEIKKLLEKLGLDGVRKVKKMQEKFAFVYFLSVEQRNAAEAALQGYRWKGQELKVRQAKALDPERFLKRKQQNEASAGAGPSEAGEGDGPAGKRPRA